MKRWEIIVPTLMILGVIILMTFLALATQTEKWRRRRTLDKLDEHQVLATKLTKLGLRKNDV